MRFLLKILQGGLIGIAMVIPGFSGGTIACLVGIYDELIESISGFRKHPKQSFFTLLPYLIGIFLFALIFIIPITWGINNYPFVTVSLFAGLLIGGLPSFYQNIKGKGNKVNIISSVVGAIVVLAVVIPSLFLGNSYVSLVNVDWWMYILVFLMGVIASAALVVPGISGSMILLICGFYNPIMDMVKAFFASIASSLNINISLDFTGDFSSLIGPEFILPSFIVCLVFGLGVIVGFILISKIMKFLLTNYKDATYFAIFGFILASLVGIYANGNYYNNLSVVEIILAIIFLIVGFIGSYYASKIAGKKENDKIEIEDKE